MEGALQAEDTAHVKVRGQEAACCLQELPGVAGVGHVPFSVLRNSLVLPGLGHFPHQLITTCTLRWGNAAMPCLELLGTHHFCITRRPCVQTSASPAAGSALPA